MAAVEEVYKRFGEPFKVPISRIDKAPLGPEAPSYAVIPMNLTIPANKIANPQIQICDFGTSFMIDDDVESATLHTPATLLPPEAFFNEKITTPAAADVWTLGLSLYEILGECPLFEVWADDPDDIIGEMVSTLGRLPSRWWEKWEKRKEFFLDDDGSWNPDFQRIQTPIFRRLDRRLWDMGRGETAETSEFEIKQGELEDLESLLRGMLRYEPTERMTARQVVQSRYMDKWARPAWEKQKTSRSST